MTSSKNPILKVMTWNLLNDIWINLSDENYQKAFRDKKYLEFDTRVKTISEHILKNDPDIVCLQEMTDNSVNILKKYIGNIYTFSKIGYQQKDYWKDTYLETNLKPYTKNGNCTLIKKKYSFKSQTSIKLSDHGNIALMTLITTNNNHLEADYDYDLESELLVINVHLDARYKTYRSQQLNSLKNILKKKDKDKFLIFVCGDFNSDTHEHKKLLLEPNKLVDVNSRKPTFFYNDLILDKIYFRLSKNTLGNLKYSIYNSYRFKSLKNVIQKFGSDHYYQILTLNLFIN